MKTQKTIVVALCAVVAIFTTTVAFGQWSSYPPPCPPVVVSPPPRAVAKPAPPQTPQKRGPLVVPGYMTEEEFYAPAWSNSKKSTKSTPTAVAPAERLLPLVTKGLSNVESYDEAVKAAMEWRELLQFKSERGAEQEKALAKQLAEVNQKIEGHDGVTGPVAWTNMQGWKTLYKRDALHWVDVSGPSLADSILRLKIAERVVRDSDPLLARRFAIEADWIKVWVNVAGAKGVDEFTAYWWSNIAKVWAGNAVNVAEPILLREEPFKRILPYLSPRDIRGLQGNPFLYDQKGHRGATDFYGIRDIPQDPWVWLEFNLIDPTHGAAPTSHPSEFWEERIPDHPEMVAKINSLVEELVK